METISSETMELCKVAVRSIYDIQKLRIALQLRIKRLVRDNIMSPEEAKKFYKIPLGLLKKAEKSMEKIAWNYTKDMPIVKNWLIKIHGIGPRLASLIVANIGDISRFPTRGKLYAYAGLHVLHHVELNDGTKFVARKYFENKDDNRVSFVVECERWKKYNKELVAQIQLIHNEYFINLKDNTRFTAFNLKETDIEYEFLVKSEDHLSHKITDIKNINTKAVRRNKGVRSNWNTELQVALLGKFSTSIIKLGGPYRTLFDQYKSRIIQREVQKGKIIWGTLVGEEKTEDDFITKKGNKLVAVHYDPSVKVPDKPPKTPEWTIGHIHNMACRKVATFLLSHIWEVWREMEGLPTRDPYPIEYQGHTTKIDPWEMITKE